jgi:hypothetical protein
VERLRFLCPDSHANSKALIHSTLVRHG